MSWWEWTLASIGSAVPGWALWRWRCRRDARRMIEDMMAERRARYGGAIKLPGDKQARPLARPPRTMR